VVQRVQQSVVQDAGHMIHHDQPDALARLIEPFLASSD
jgi:pimeloyl-ACP methyl ester carboxylesterase